MSSRSFNLNGIDHDTGKYLLSLSLADIAEIARGKRLNTPHLRDLTRRARLGANRQNRREQHLGVAEDIDDKDLAQTGWGVIFPATLEEAQLDAIKEALAPLLRLRQQQAGEHYREFSGIDGFRAADTKTTFLERAGADAANAADPSNGVPYYLMLVGGPEQIPFDFQCELDVVYAVGRLSFGTLEHYANYGCTVVAAERGDLKVSPRATFFGVQNPDDTATTLSATQLVQPLAQRLGQATLPHGWQFETYAAEEATKSMLSQLINEAAAPALLFTASHGMGFRTGHPMQTRHQGALLCQDWPGPESHSGPIPEAYYFSADDVCEGASVAGMVAFHFACFSGGTPEFDDYAKRDFRAPRRIAERAFVASLPQKLLGHPRGGALAVIAHVERAWGYSFLSGTGKGQLSTFDSTIKRLLKGQPVGVALEYFNDRYAAWATTLTNYLQQVDAGFVSDPEDAEFRLAELWTAQNDSRGYALLGDPAARLSLRHEFSPDSASEGGEVMVPQTDASSTAP